MMLNDQDKVRVWNLISKGGEGWYGLSPEHKSVILNCGDMDQLVETATGPLLSGLVDWALISVDSIATEIDGYLEDLAADKVKIMVYDKDGLKGVLMNPDRYNGLISDFEKLTEPLKDL